MSDDEYEDPEFQIVTIPDLESTWKMLTEIIVEFQSCLSNVKRIENIIYPLLQSDVTFLASPHPNKIEELSVLHQKIKWLIS